MYYSKTPPVVLTEKVRASSPILRFLDNKQIPWWKTIGELVEQFGVHDDPFYKWPVVALTTDQPFLDGMVRTLSFNFMDYYGRETYLDAHTTTSDLSGDVYVAGASAEENLAHTLAQLQPVLGEPSDSSVSNTISKRWLEPGLVALQVICWPRALQSEYVNDAHARHPFLTDICTCSIDFLFIPPCSAKEKDWYTSCTILHSFQQEIVSPQQTDKFPALRHYPDVSYPPQSIALSADKKALIYTFDSSYFYVVALQSIHGFCVDCWPPDRGGYDTYELSLLLKKDFGSNAKNPFKKIVFAGQYQYSNEIDTLAKILSETVGLTRVAST